MDIEIKKLLVSSTVQVFVGAGAWFLGWRIARAQLRNAKHDLRIKLFEQRYAIYAAFREFIAHCAVHDKPKEEAIAQFEARTEKFEFLFGPEISKYRKEIMANALAKIGMEEGLPCEVGPVIGGLVGYFKGSTVLKDAPSIAAWFVRQHLGDLQRYFAPYLDYGLAGVDVSDITMQPPDLPDPPLVRRRVGKSSDEWTT